MHSLHSTLRDGRHFISIGQPVRPVVRILTANATERSALEEALSSAGFRALHLSTDDSFANLRPIDGPTCLLLDSTILPPVLPLDLGLPVICLAAAGDIAATVRAMKAGATDVLPRPVTASPLIAAVRNALGTSDALLREATELHQLKQRYSELSKRQQQVMNLVATGLMNKQVAYELSISEVTVKVHRGRVMRKMEARSLASLVQMANRLGLTAASRRD